MAQAPYWCCCGGGGGVPPGLLKAIPCTECCPEYTTGLPVDPEAVPGWEARPVFYLHGRCWQIVGLWDHEDPPDWMIVRRVFDFLRYQVCEACFAPGDCGILAPGCDAVGFVPDRYRLRVTHSGQGDHVNGSIYGRFTWNITTDTEYGPTQPCYKGCLTSPIVLAGGNLAPQQESFHELGGITPVVTRVYGTILWQSDFGDQLFTAELVTPLTKLATNYRLQWSNTVNVSQQVTGEWQGRNQRFDIVEAASVRSNWASKLTGPFWLKGNATAGAQLRLRGIDIAVDPTGTVRWSLRPIAFCCNDSPPPPDPKDDPQDEFGGGVGDGGSDPTPPPGGVQPDGTDPNAAAIEGAEDRNPMRRCRGCGG